MPRMDQRLFQAAHTGSIEVLHELLIEDPLILERVALASLPDTPLHIAVLAGNLEFSKEIIRRRPGFASQLNRDGFSAIHMASANGHIEILKELLKVDSSLCKLMDRDGRNPLHLAAMRGAIDVISELLAACPDSAGEATAQAETVLHLAVKCNQFEAFRFLLEQPILHDLLNAKDQEGNTVLHLAASRRQIQTVESLLNREYGTMVEVNAKNAKNLTALDVLDIMVQNSYEVGDMVIVEILLRAGAVRSQEVIRPTLTYNQVERVNQITQRSELLPTKSFWKEFGDEISSELENSSSKARSALMVVAVLISTVTFQAGVNPPGGFWQENSQENVNNNSTKTVNRPGEAIMASQFKCFVLFLTFNTTGFIMSLIIICLLASRFPLKSWVRLAVVAMVTTYLCALCFITPYHLYGFGRSVHTKFMIVAFFLGAVASWKFWWVKKCAAIIQKRWNKASVGMGSSAIHPLPSTVP